MVGTSLLVITALAIPTLMIHWLLGHINWTLAGEFALGQVPGSTAGSQFAYCTRLPVDDPSRDERRRRSTARAVSNSR